MELTYVAVDDWCVGKTSPSLKHLMRMVELFDGAYTLDQLAFGHAPPSAKRVEPELDREAIKRLLGELRATNEQIEALGEYERSAAGQFQRYTRTYVAAFVEAFAAAREHGQSTKQAIASAKEAAANARANAEAIALNLRAVSEAELAKLGDEVRAVAAAFASDKQALDSKFLDAFGKQPSGGGKRSSSSSTAERRGDSPSTKKKPPSGHPQRRGASRDAG